jgi:tetratricopeptide (TPR) repeat protein
MAVELDPGFARAYADIAIAYAYLNMFQPEKDFREEVNRYADKAMLYDPELAQSLVAKALYHTMQREYEASLPYLEKALKSNPNSSLVINMLSSHYANYVPNTEKYLEYALKGLRLDVASHDSLEASILYLHVSNSFIQSGFVEEAHRYIGKSIDYYPENPYAAVLKAYIQYARNSNLEQTRDSLLAIRERHPETIDLLKEIGNITYYLRDFEQSSAHYLAYLGALDSLNMPHPSGEYAKIGVALAEVGRNEESEDLFIQYRAYAEEDESVYKHLSLSVYHSWIGNRDSAMNEMSLFAEEEFYPYWYILFLEQDPLLDDMYTVPEFQELMGQIRVRFWKYHRSMRSSLRSKGLI